MRVAFFVVLLAGILIRLWFFPGYVNAWVQDEGRYGIRIMDIVRGQDFFFHDAATAVTINPAHTISARIAFLYPEAWMVSITRDARALFALPMLLSILDLVIVFLIARDLAGPRAGIFAMALLALTPIHVHFSGRVMPEAYLHFAFDLAILLFLRWEARRKCGGGGGTSHTGAETAPLLVALGLVLGIGSYVKEVMTLLAVLILVVLAVRRNFRPCAALVGVLVITHLAASLFFLFRTGDFFYFSDIQTKTRLEKYLHEYEGVRYVELAGRFRLAIPRDPDVLFHLRNLFSPTGHHFGERGYPFGLLFPLAALAGFWTVRSSRRVALLYGTIAIYIAYLEFGFAFVRFEEGRIILYPIFKEVMDAVRYPSFLCGIAAVGAGIGIDAWFRMPSPRIRAAVGVVLGVYALVAIVALQDITESLQEPIRDLEAATRILSRTAEADAGVRLYFLDGLARDYFDVMTSFRYHDRTLLVLRPEDVPRPRRDRTNLVIFGGARSADLSHADWMSTVPFLAGARMETVAVIAGPMTINRPAPLEIHRIVALRQNDIADVAIDTAGRSKPSVFLARARPPDVPPDLVIEEVRLYRRGADLDVELVLAGEPDPTANASWTYVARLDTDMDSSTGFSPLLFGGDVHARAQFEVGTWEFVMDRPGRVTVPILGARLADGRLFFRVPGGDIGKLDDVRFSAEAFRESPAGRVVGTCIETFGQGRARLRRKN